MLFRNFIRKEEADDYLSQVKALHCKKATTVDTSDKYQSKRVVEDVSVLNYFPELIRKVYDTCKKYHHERYVRYIRNIR